MLPVGRITIVLVTFSVLQLILLSAGKLKQPSPKESEIRQLDRVRLRVPAAERVYPRFLFTSNLIRAGLVSPAESKYLCISLFS